MGGSEKIPTPACVWTYTHRQHDNINLISLGKQAEREEEEEVPFNLPKSAMYEISKHGINLFCTLTRKQNESYVGV